ncbi:MULTISPECIES: apolipoprotein N-acyltransferase [Deinococcus]|uniref:apolipoprotein N-acyltransferase n=1 Tax=Deinococcus TaxID=1298 RepID=UPI0016668713|nr:MULTISPECIES: apolipoprotein N-acyltransferase [Deinococcus]MDK2011189.1 apolipoprotein N-acyltransferase [Deinococcus sp. 43]GGB56634.1 apolipoprotein N-acyltransferase [Deinococcus soli (ex Cha et al. 2016)]
MPTPATGLLLGLLLAACGLPLPWSWAAFLPLALILPFIAAAPTPRHAAGRAFWVGFGYFGLHLWWIGAFLVNLLDFPPLAAAAALLFALEGAFLAAAAFLATSATHTRTGRIWTLAGAWVILEWLRFLGPLAFPWPTLGYTLLPTPTIQIADLGGVLLGSVLVTLTAASLAHAWTERQQQGRRPLTPALLAAVAWAAALGYGLTRTPGTGPEQPMRVMRVTFDVFGRASGDLPAETQFAQTRAASLNRPAGSVVVWSETAITYPGAPDTRPDFPGPGITGAGGIDYGVTPISPLADPPPYNTAIALDTAGRVTSRSDKSKLVPFGEEFPFQPLLGPIYRMILTPLGFAIPNFRPNPNPTPLTLNGVLYGAYICYDSVFPRVARALAAQGAQVLVNPSNDGWYQGWGVQQHFNMGRVRAIETRRWLVRSVNNGVAGSVNDLGQPIQTVQDGTELRTLDVRPRLLTGTTLYVRLGDWPALMLALGMILYGMTRRERDF